MSRKFISLATAIVLLDVFLRSRLYSNDPLFLFASSNIALNLSLLVVTSLTVVVSFKNSFRRWWTFVGCAVLALVFGIIGLLGTFFSDVFYAFPQFLMPFDYMILLEAGVVFGICALSYQHQPIPARWQPAQLSAHILNKFALPDPKTLQSPNGSRPVV